MTATVISLGIRVRGRCGTSLRRAGLGDELIIRSSIYGCADPLSCPAESLA